MRAMTMTTSVALTMLLSVGSAFAAPTALEAKNGLGTRIAATVSRMAARHVERQDFKAWLKEPGNEQLKTYHEGAKKEAGVGSVRAGTAYWVAMTAMFGAEAIAAHVTPNLPGAFTATAIAGVGTTAAITAAALRNLETTKRQAATRTVELAGTMAKSPSAARVQAWTANRVIDSAPASK